MMTPDAQGKPEFGEPDPALFAALTDDENKVLQMHLTSGWYKQSAVWPALSDIWRETSEILDDMHAAWRIAFAAAERGRAACKSCGARSRDVDLEKITVRALADGTERAEWHCTDRAACVTRFAPDAACLLAAGGAL